MTFRSDSVQTNTDQFLSPKSRRNVLLLHHPVGHARPSTFRLPKTSHTYGKKGLRDQEGVMHALKWHSNKKHTQEILGPDYIRTNKAAIKEGATTAKGYAEFFKTMKIPRLAKIPNRPHTAIEPLPYNDSTCFGSPCRPSTPIASILSNLYQNNWANRSMESARKRLEDSRAAKARARNPMLRSRDTKASLGHNVSLKKTEISLPHVNKFKHVSAKINSFRPTLKPFKESIFEKSQQQNESCNSQLTDIPANSIAE